MRETMTLSHLLRLVREARANWEAALGRVPRARMEVPGAEGAWSVKDVIAHICWSEREMVNLLTRRTLSAGSPLWELPQDERNRVVFEENRSRPLDDVLREADETYRRLLPLIEQLDEEDLHDPSRLDMPPDWKPYQILAGSTYLHYQEHAKAIEAWAAQGLPGSAR